VPFYFLMMILTSFLLLGLGPSSSISAILYATHYSGTVTVLSLSGNSLTVVSSTKTCGTQPSWLTLDSASRTLYCLDEFNYGAGGTLSTYSASSSGTLTQTAKINIPGNGVHSTLYGGSDGKSFQAIAH
jgi:6-phosphogluconolactonase (cycloisomerase 2 family)